MFKRVGLFIITNLAVMLVLGIVIKLFGLDQMGGGLVPTILIGSVIGFDGAFISLAMSKKMALMSTRAQVITEPRNQVEYWLLQTVRRQAQQAGIGMPTVAVFDSASPNAFAKPACNA